ANATWHDLVAILDGRTAQDLATWSRVWVEEAGRPRIAAAVTTADDRIDALTLRQSDPSGRGRTWTQRVDVHVGWTDSTRTIPVVIDGSSVDVPDAAGLPAPRYVIPDGRGLGYAHFELEAATRDFLLDSLAAVSPAVARAAAALALQDAMLAGEVEPARLLES